MLRIEFTRLTKNAGPLTKKIYLAPDGTLVKDGSACVMEHGTAERVRVAGVDALGTLIEALTPSQAIALGALRADLPDRVEITTKKRSNSSPLCSNPVGDPQPLHCPDYGLCAPGTSTGRRDTSYI